MPELPEVEVTRRLIENALVGRTIASVETTAASYFFLTSPTELRARLTARRVERLERIGKYLIAMLNDGSRLLLHLGMTGQLFAAGATSPRLLSAAKRRALAPESQLTFEPDRHTHLVIGFRDAGPRVYFRDVRKFGKVLWIPKGASHERLERLGVDALAAKADDFFAATRARRVPIKSLLLDQAVIAGVGNIYADEALFLSGISVKRSARRLTRAECETLIHHVRDVLRRSIRKGGSSISDYVRPDGVDGLYQNERFVYARTGEPCRRCKTPVRRVVIAQRSSHFCPVCQR
jgi:formamidopyrimidine-DNA glycosylase